MQVKKLLILGSDFFTYRAVEEAKKMGVYVIVADYLNETPTKMIADESWLVSTTDIDTLYEKALNEKISGIFCGASDFNVENMRVLCKRLKLPLYCSNDFAWAVSRNKALFKDICFEVGAPVSKDYSMLDISNSDELDSIEYPVVVKPVDKSGNRGVSFCYNSDELKKGYLEAKNISDNERIVIEKMLSGTEHHVCYAADAGEFKLISFAEASHDKNQLSNIYSFERTTNRFLQQYLDEANDAAIRVFKRIGCTDGLVWLDTMRDSKSGKFYFLEMGYRFAGAVASSHMQKRMYGFDPVKWMLECSLGMKHEFDFDKIDLRLGYDSFVALAHMFTKQDAVIKEINGANELKNKNDIYLDLPKKVGDKVRGLATVALINIYGKNKEDLIEKLKYVNDTFKIYDQDGSNILIYYTDYKNILESFE